MGDGGELRWRQDLLKIQVKVLLYIELDLLSEMTNVRSRFPNSKSNPLIIQPEFVSASLSIRKKGFSQAFSGRKAGSESRCGEHSHVLVMLRIQAALVDCTIFVGPLDCAERV